MDLEIKHRPRVFDQVVGQRIIVEELKKMSKKKKRISQKQRFSVA